MRIHKIAYTKFYYIFLDYFRDHDLREEEWKKPSTRLARRSPKLWYIERKEGQYSEPVIYKILNGVSDEKRIYYRYLTDFNNKDKKTADNFQDFDDEIMIAGFEHIGCLLPEEYEVKLLLEDDLKAKVLFQKFLEMYYPGYLAAHLEFKIFDFQTGSLLDHQPKESDAKNETKSHVTLNEGNNQEGMEYKIVNLVREFYRYIGIDQLKNAWDLLAPIYRHNLFKDIFEDFSIGYTYTKSVENVHIWDIVVKGQIATCKVFYIDSLTAFSTVELGKIDRIKIADLDDFVKRVKKIAEQASDTSLINFDKIEIQKLFEPAASEYIWYKCGKNPLHIQELLPDEENLTVPRLYNISSINIDGNWMIKGIEPITSRFIR